MMSESETKVNIPPEAVSDAALEKLTKDFLRWNNLDVLIKQLSANEKDERGWYGWTADIIKRMTGYSIERPEDKEKLRETLLETLADGNDFPRVRMERKPQSDTAIMNITERMVLEPQSDTAIMNSTDVALSFSGCGLLGVYHIGVAWALSKHGGTFLSKVKWFAGASAGSLIAATLATRGTSLKVIEDCKEFYVDLVDKVREATLGAFSVSLLDAVDKYLRTKLPENAHERASNRLYVSLTLKANNKKNVTVSGYDSRDNLIQYLKASSCIPLITARERYFKVDGVKYIDGGFTENQPTVSYARTVTVAPYAGDCDICPPSYDPEGKNPEHKHVFFAASKKRVEEYYQQGIQHAIEFLKRENLYP